MAAGYRGAGAGVVQQILAPVCFQRLDGRKHFFFTMGKSMLNGRVLYRDVFDHKGPVLYLLYGLAACVDNTGFGGVGGGGRPRAALWGGGGGGSAGAHPQRWARFPAAPSPTAVPLRLLLPLLAAALFGAESPCGHPAPCRCAVLCCTAFFSGCALWLKYTVLGFYLVWAVLWRCSSAAAGAGAARPCRRGLSRRHGARHCRGSSTSACRVRWGLVHLLLL